MNKSHDARRVPLHHGNVQGHNGEASPTRSRRFRPDAGVGWRAAMLEFEHQAEHWDTPEHGETGHLIAQALRTAVDIARGGGLKCEHRVDTQPLARHAADRTPVRFVKPGTLPVRAANIRAS